ncbi:exocyst complex component EXO70B1-like [Actinidia eriantha]|uniref:exocyst complex component EXO70B1-like n=1 Tax=Actinidia eriantha TaxID=165200 RepID=UPI00258FC177|nr:exocyst complex component EXO70B1-like [Actinidia eriantha]
MEKIYHTAEKSGSFISRNTRRKSDITSPKTPDLFSIDEKLDNDTLWRENVEDVDDHDVHQVSEDIDRFTDTLSAVDDKSNPPEVPDAVEAFSKIVESRIAKYYSANSRSKFDKMTEEDSFFLEAVRRISKLTAAFCDLPSSSTTTPSLNRTSMVLQRAMAFLEEEFRDLLEESRSSDSDRCVLPEGESADVGDGIPVYSPEVVTKMTRIAAAMVSSEYETECCQVYSVSRRNAFNEALKRLEFDTISIDDVQRMQWEPLEHEISKWIKAVKHCAAVLFPGERKLCDAVFSENPSISVILFSNLARAVVIQVLNFADAVVLTRRSAEKLFKYLDMHETLRELILAVKSSCSEDSSHELTAEISAAGDRIGEAAVYIFCDLENSIKGDMAKTPVPGGAIHPLTRYVMNYLKYACEYKDTLEQIFQKHKAVIRSTSSAKSNGSDERESPNNHRTVKKSSSASPFAIQLMTVTELLDENLDSKSILYKDHSLRYIFLMNNGRYILQKIKGSNEILQLVGDTWYRMRSTVVRQYHKNYQRETWGKLLQCLGHEGLQVNGKVYKPILKDRFKSFNLMFDDIHKTQSTWVVSDEQLQSELRVSVSAVVIPAYRSFLGRFKQYLESGKQAEKYIKYQPEDIETLIEGLFDGNPTSMGRRRT